MATATPRAEPRTTLALTIDDVDRLHYVLTYALEQPEVTDDNDDTVAELEALDGRLHRAAHRLGHQLPPQPRMCHPALATAWRMPLRAGRRRWWPR